MSSTNPPPAPASRLGLSREGVLDAALALLDRQGLEGLTMRRLADELGVGTMTLYGYFRGKDELLDALIDAAAEQMAEREPRGSWRERLRELMLDIRRSHAEHPAIVELRRKRPLISPGALQVTEAAMRALRDGGFSASEAARAYRVLFIYTFGFSMFGPGTAAPTEREQTRAALRGLPPDRYPALLEAADDAAEAMADATLFEFGLERLLDGLEAMRGEDVDAPPSAGR